MTRGDKRMVRLGLKWMLCGCTFGLTAAAMCPALAGETLEGTWEGHMVTQKGKIPVNAAYNWETGKGWNFTSARNVGATSWFVTLEIQGSFKNLNGSYLARNKANAKSWGKYAFDGNFNFDKKLLVWTPDALLEGPNTLANTVVRSLTYSQDDNFEYLKGRWAAQSGDTGVMEFRRAYDGNPLKDEAAPPPDFMLPETDGEYVIKKDDFFLTVNDAGDGVISRKDADEGVRKWKFEAAPDQFPKAFRIVPAVKDDQCLQATDGDDATIALAPKEDKPDGEQYWRLENNGEAVMLTNMKLGGRAIYIENEADGQTILRSRNEAHENKWTLEKQ